MGVATKGGREVRAGSVKLPVSTRNSPIIASRNVPRLPGGMMRVRPLSPNTQRGNKEIRDAAADGRADERRAKDPRIRR